MTRKGNAIDGMAVSFFHGGAVAAAAAVREGGGGCRRWSSSAGIFHFSILCDDETPQRHIIQGEQGVVLDSASQREAKRGQSTNRKGEMSRATHQ